MKNIKNNKKLEAILFLLGMLGIFTVNAFATAPANDNFANAEQLTGIRVSVSRSNAEATKETGEPNHTGNPGGKSVWFRWTAPMTRMMRFTTNRSEGNIDTLLHVYRGSDLATLSTEGFSNDIHNINKRSFTRVRVQAGETYYIAIDGSKFQDQPAAEGTFVLDIHPSFQFQGADYDSDGITDIAVFRPSTGIWYLRQSSTNGAPVGSVSWGANGDIPVVSSNTGSGTNEFTVFRPSNGTWYNRALSGIRYIYWGKNGDIPVADQFGGSSFTEFTVYRPSTGEWFINHPTQADQYYRFGTAEDIPVPGQYSADSFADVAVYRPSDGTWYFMVRQSTNHTQDTFKAIRWGLAGDKPVPADYDGDGILDIAVYRPSTGVWYVLRSSDNQIQTAHFGLPNDIPTTGDFNGDGIFDYAVFRPSTGIWYVARPTGVPAQNFDTYYFGLSGDIPVTSNNGR